MRSAAQKWFRYAVMNVTRRLSGQGNPKRSERLFGSIGELYVFFKRAVNVAALNRASMPRCGLLTLNAFHFS
jgi:hypothetical protein